MPRPPHRLTPVALLAFLAAVWGPALAQGRLIAPGDGMATYYPLRVLSAAAIRAGEGPFWNPYAFGGLPLMAALQAGAFFPGNWTFLVLPAPWAYNASVLLAYAVAGLAMLGFGRAVGMTAVGALVAAIAFAGGGFMTAHAEHLAMIQAAGLLPALLWAIERASRRPERRGAALAFGAVLGLQILAGHPQMVVFSLLVAGPYALWRSLGSPRPGRVAGRLALAGALGVGLAAIQLLPSAALIAESQRHGFSYAELVADALPVRQLITLWMPFLFGAPPTAWFPTPSWGAGPWIDEIVGYAGLGTLGLALVGAWRARQDGAARFWLAVAVIGLALALGGQTPLYHLWAHLPLLNTLRVPGRHLLELDAALAVLAGLGVSALQRGEAAPRAALGAWALAGAPVIGVAAALAVAGGAIAARVQPFVPAGTDMTQALSLGAAAVWWPIAVWALTGLALALAFRARAAGRWLAVVAVIALDLGVFGTHQGWWASSPAIADVPAFEGRPERAGRSLTVAAGDYPYVAYARVKALEAPGYGTLLHQRATNGFDAFIKARYAADMGEMTHGGAVTDPALFGDAHHGLDLLSTRTVRLEAPLAATPDWRARLRGPRWRRLPDEPGVAVFENRRALPRAWRVEAARVADAAAIDGHVSGDRAFDPRRLAWVESPLGAARLTPGAAEAAARTPNRLEVATDGPGDGLLVVSESYDAGWRAEAEGRALPVRRVDGVLLGVEVPPGAHRVSLRYAPPHWEAGLAGTGLALLLMVGWAARPRRRRG